jgi:hypothetical protein
MSDTEKTPAYIALQEEIKNFLARAFEEERLTKEELLAILYLFGFTNTERELEAFLYIFAESFPILKGLTEKKAGAQKVEFDQGMAGLVQKILHDDPLLAAQVGVEVARPGTTLAKLKEQYPAIVKYL